MKKYFLIISFLFSLVIQSQDFKTSFVKEIPLKADVFYGADVFENIYYSLNNVLFKKTSDKIYQYNNLALGNISSVSISNPLEIVMFYKDFNTVLILDNTLNIIQKLQFLDKNISLVAKADKNKLWLFNTDVQQLELYDYKSQTVLAKSQPQSLLDPKELKGNTNFAWVKTASNKIKIFNSYGSMLNSLDYTVDNFAVMGTNRLIFNADAQLYYLSDSLHKIAVKQSLNIVNLSIANNKIYLFDSNRIFIYTLLKN